MGSESVIDKIVALRAEYLFFIGATFVALLFLARQKWVSACVAYGLALFWLFFYLPITYYVVSLSSDSFAETANFNLDEARFWLYSLGQTLQPIFSLKKLVGYSAVAFGGFYVLRYLLTGRWGWSARKFRVATACIATAFMGVSFHSTASTAVSYYLDNSAQFELTERNFRNPAPAMQRGSNGIQLVVYIGESTGVMNMGLYGYPRNTTPRLSELARQDAGMLVFHHVLSTHVHTSPSLLEALSLGLQSGQEMLPIAKRKRVPIVDVLRQAGLESRVISNQGMGGAFDHSSSVIFRHSNNTFRVKEQAGQTGAAAKRWDDEFFAEQLDKEPAADGRRVIFLHSYAGHGPYFDNVPPAFRKPVDDTLARLGPAAVLDDPRSTLKSIEDYDATVRYVDHNVAQVIERVRGSSHPSVLVYFSDHGESPFAGLGHDSARFRHEMARVPLVVYFNEAARRAQPKLFEKYQGLTRTRNIATLAQLPSTMLDLLGIAPAPAARQAMTMTPLFGEPTRQPPILIRDTQQGYTFVNLNRDPLPAVAADGQKMVDVTDAETRNFVSTHAMAGQAACDSRPRTFEDMSRRLLVQGCPVDQTLIAQGNARQ